MKNSRRIASSILLFSLVLGITLASATTENNYKTDNNFLTDISETTHTENGYKTNIIINPHTTGIYALEDGYKLDLTINTQGIGGSLKENGYQLNLVPEKTFPDIPDVAVSKIGTSKTILGQGYSTIINVTVTNQALNYETFWVTVYANITTVKTHTITLLSGSSEFVASTWDSTATPYGNYTISAYAEPVPGEWYTEDNTYAYGWVFVTIVGDVDGDKDVDVGDQRKVQLVMFTTPASHNWNPNMDIDGDLDVDVGDQRKQQLHMFESW